MRCRVPQCLLALAVLAGAAAAAPRSLTLATTTSVNDTGLLDFVLPEFERRSGVDVKVVAVGSGQALELARRGDADVVLAHAPDLEHQFMRQGHAAGHWRLMYNHFIIVGTATDPARVRSASSAAQAFSRIAETKAAFVSRGDNSGTHQRELAIWKAAKIEPRGDWYLESGSAMAAALRLADEKDGYALSDIGTYLAQKRNLRLAILYDHGSELLNVYSLMAISPKKHPSINYSGAVELVRYLLAPETLKRIGSLGADRFGRPLFQVYGRRPPASASP
jgi:tungstate transport system substrate-binding protein